MDSVEDTAGVIAPPPLLYAGGLAAGLLLQRAASLPRLPRQARIGGALLAAVALALGGWGFRSLRRAGTEVNPTRPTTALVTEGPYRFTRNPLYLGLAVMYVGLSALARASGPLLLLPAVLAAVQRGVIAREERYLERRFGEQYRAYTASVRRWL
jgi:protein-S-isoprenylcysteine O-methyltransferase Ste14